jgi:hypothetical protein
MLDDPIRVLVDAQHRLLYLDSNRDYIVVLPDKPLKAQGGLWVIGGHDVLIRGGEVAPARPPRAATPGDVYGLFLKNQTGTVHVEGIYFHGRGLGEGIVLDEGAGATVQIENCRIEISYRMPLDRSIHPDVVQTWRGPRILRIDHLTGHTTSKGFNLQPYEYDVQSLGDWDIRNVNLVGNGSSYILWKNDRSRQGKRRVPYWRERHSQVYVLPGRSWGVAWPDTGVWSGVAIGRPPRGDFVPRGRVGRGYHSPGYE